MKRIVASAICLFAMVLTTAAQAAPSWSQGRHYSVLAPLQKTNVAPGKIEVLEVFSYGCVACNSFEPVMQTLKARLPANAQISYLHASFKPTESWPMFQRAYLTAQALGIADRTHQAIYDAVWKSDELAVVDRTTHRLKKPQPTIEDAARCYERLTGVKRDVFLTTARSFAVEAKIRASDAQVLAMQVPGTPCIVVNGKYRVNMDALQSVDELTALVAHLVQKESTGS